jgi:hypothetical protein
MMKFSQIFIENLLIKLYKTLSHWNIIKEIKIKLLKQIILIDKFLIVKEFKNKKVIYYFNLDQ